MDRFEQNDSAATATDLRTISGTVTESSLSIEANDPDHDQSQWRVPLHSGLFERKCRTSPSLL